jgi:hypothetical protein
MAKADGKLALAGQTVLAKKGAKISPLVYLGGNMDNNSNC